MLSKRIAKNRDGIQTLNTQCRTTIDIFERYHDVLYESARTSFDENDNQEEVEEEDESDDSEREDSGINSDSSDSSVCGEFDGSMHLRLHCERCNMVLSNIRGQKVEEKDVGWNVLHSEIASVLRVLIKAEKVAAEDIALLCASHEEVDRLTKELPRTLTAKDGVFDYGSLVIVGAEDFAVNCSKLRKSSKRKSDGGQPVQKKFLMVDTVRRFKGLEAEVLFHICTFLRQSQHLQILFRLRSL